MARRGGGYRAPKDYDPSRGRGKGGKGRPGRAARPEGEREDRPKNPGGGRGDTGGQARDHGRVGDREHGHGQERARDRGRDSGRDRARSREPERDRERDRGHDASTFHSTNRAQRSDGARVFSFDADGRARGGDRTRDGDRTGKRHRTSGEAAGAAPFARSELERPGRLKARRTSAADVAGTTFAELGLGGNIVRALTELGAERPFPIQAVTIPDALAGRDVLGRGRTGSGKTIAFGAALVERLLQLKAQGAFGQEAPRERPQRGVRSARPRPQGARPAKALILAPTRELALQIDRTVQPIARSVGLFTAQLVGGMPFEPQLHALRRGADIVIGTPGRIEDLVLRGHLDLRQVLVSVLDEADHMCELGFLEPVQRLLRRTDRGGQRLLFSATLDRGVDQLVAEFLRKPAVHEIAEDDDTSGPVEHRVLIVLREDKDEVLVELARSGERVMMFCRTRAGAERVTELLAGAGVAAIALHGDLSQARRQRNLEKFTEGRARVLVATDVAARGIHVEGVDLVVQADPPDDPKTYVHRAGRTGRNGNTGTVLTVIPRTRQKRTRELLAAVGIEPASFDDYAPGEGF